MSGSLAYLDSSALVKLAIPEAESAALFELLVAWPKRVSSTLAHVELFRTLRKRRAAADAMLRGEAIVADLELIGISDSIIKAAGQLDPRELRALDAIHLATAVAIGAELGCLISYDVRLNDAAKAMGLRVLAPQ